MGRLAATALLLALLSVAAYEAVGDMATLKERAAHDPVAATRGLIARRLGGTFVDQVGPLSSLSLSLSPPLRLPPRT